jgi:hypothetical protein
MKIAGEEIRGLVAKAFLPGTAGRKCIKPKRAMSGNLVLHPHGNLNISRQAGVAAKRRKSTENHVFRLTVLRREKFTFQCGYQ